jgi:hypothetical protein
MFINVIQYFFRLFTVLVFKIYKMHRIASIVLLGENFTCGYEIKQIVR